MFQILNLVKIGQR